MNEVDNSPRPEHLKKDVPSLWLRVKNWWFKSKIEAERFRDSIREKNKQLDEEIARGFRRT